MNFIQAALELLPCLVNLIKEAVSNRNREEAIRYLENILGETEENRVRISLALNRLKAEEEINK